VSTDPSPKTGVVPPGGTRPRKVVKRRAGAVVMRPAASENPRAPVPLPASAPSSTPATRARWRDYFAPCPRGLEPWLARELSGPLIGARDVQVRSGGVTFRGDLAVEYRANLESRLATRILRQVASGDYANEQDVFRLAAGVPWSRLFDVSRTLRVYVTAQKSPLKSLEFITLRVKDAICDQFRAVCGQRPNVDTRDPRVRIHLFVGPREATLYLDTSGEPLYQRGAKIAKVSAPLKENLACGLLQLIGWLPGTPLLDPMCGSGTFLLEAAQMSLNDAPGLSREADAFAFTRLTDVDTALWRGLRRQAAQRRQAAASLPLWGSDHAADAISRSRQNLAFAGLDDLVHLQQADILDLDAPAPRGILLCNPPYGERLGEAQQLAALYPKLGDHLKRKFAGWRCGFLSSDIRLPKLIGLKADQGIALFNGALACRLYIFELVAGQYRA
jgi:putative N6-adenine-specific DNA methylase